MNMAFNKIGEGPLAQFWLCTWNQKEFFGFSSGKFSSAAPTTMLSHSLLSRSEGFRRMET